MAQPVVRLRVLSSLTVALYTRGYVYAAGLHCSLSVVPSSRRFFDCSDGLVHHAGLVNLAFHILRLLSRPISPCGELLVQIRRGLRPLGGGHGTSTTYTSSTGTSTSIGTALALALALALEQY